MYKVIFLVFSISFCSMAQNSFSSKMEKFELSQCFEKGCFRVHGLKGFFSNAGDRLSSRNVTVEFFNTKKPLDQKVCDSFSYDFLGKYMVCDNTDLAEEKSFIISGDFDFTENRF